jgi:DNA-binding SARP family transcriptional activator
MPPLVFRTLGRIDLAREDGESVPSLLAQPKRQLLLAYLCVESRRQPVRRTDLVELFWPQSEGERARGSLRQALHCLRTALGSQAVRRPSEEELAVDRAIVGCDAVDLIEHASADPARAVDLFHGEFLGGVQLADVADELGDWLWRMRQVLRESAVIAAKALSANAERSGEGAAAQYWLRRATELAPDDEAAARSLMTLQWRAGDRGAALKTFEALKRTLSVELDVAPDPSTLALAQQVRASTDVPSGAARPHASVAILPFVERGPVVPAGYLGHGLADELARVLAQCVGFRLASRAATVDHAGGGRDVGTLRVALDVDWVVDGRVALAGGQLRIEARFVELATGRVVDQPAFDVVRTDVHRASMRVLSAFFAASGVTPNADERALLERDASRDPRAFDAFLQGRHHWRKRPRDSGLALSSLRQAVERDPGFALAQAALADVYNTLGSWEAAAMPALEAFPRAQDAALAAICVDPRCAEAHTSLAYAAMHYLWQWETAGRQFRRALELNPNYAHAHHWHSHHLMARGQTAASLEASLRALALDPLDLIINVHLAWHYWLAGDFDASHEQAQRAARLDADDHWVHFFTGLAFSGLGESARAVDAQRRALTLSANSPVMSAALGYAYGAAGDRRLARRTLLELPRLAGRVSVAYEQAVVETALGEQDAALDHLTEAYRQRSAWLAYVAVDPRLRPLAGHPRFESLLVAVGLDDVRSAPAR